MGAMDGVPEKTTLGELVRRRIDAEYAGNQRAFARATGLSPQAVYSLAHDKITLPQPERRRVLARELGIKHLDLLLMAGELRPDEVPAAGAPPPPSEIETVMASLGARQRSMVLDVAREMARLGKNGGAT